jgi:hypothetical protein
MNGEGTAGTDRLSALSRELEQASTELRSADADRAAELATHCADLASQAAAELDRLAGVAAEASLPGQEELL